MKWLSHCFFHIFKSTLVTLACLGLVVHPVKGATPSKEAAIEVQELFKRNQAHKKVVTWNQFFAPMMKDFDEDNEFTPFVKGFLKEYGNTNAPKMTLTKYKNPQGVEILRIIPVIEKKTVVMDVYRNEKLFISINNQPIFKSESTNPKDLLTAVAEILSEKRKMRMPASEDDVVTLKVPSLEEWKKMGHYAQLEYIRFMRSIYMEMYKLQLSRELSISAPSKKKGRGVGAGVNGAEGGGVEDGARVSSAAGGSGEGGARVGRTDGSRGEGGAIAQAAALSLLEGFFTPAWGKAQRSADDPVNSPCVLAGYMTTYSEGNVTPGRCGLEKCAESTCSVKQINGTNVICGGTSASRTIRCNPILFGKGAECVPFPDGNSGQDMTVRNNATDACMNNFIEKTSHDFDGIVCNGGPNKICEVDDANWGKAVALFNSIQDLLLREMRFCTGIKDRLSVGKASEGPPTISVTVPTDLAIKNDLKADQKNACEALKKYAIEFKLKTQEVKLVAELQTKSDGAPAVPPAPADTGSYCASDGPSSIFSLSKKATCFVGFLGLLAGIACLIRCKGDGGKRIKTPGEVGPAPTIPPPAAK